MTQVEDDVDAPGIGSQRQLSIEALEVGFPTPQGLVRAVDGISLGVRDGATLGIVGESGSGKSALCRAVMNILPSSAHVSDTSRIVFEGRDLRQFGKQESRHFWGVQMAMVFQDPMTSLSPTVKIGRQLTEPIRYHLGLDAEQARTRALDLLRDVGIPEPERRFREYPHSLSGGLRQRVTIAIALACRPKLLIADEPTTALDVTVQHQILNLLERVKADHGMTMILVTHDFGVAAGRTDDIAVMYAGQIIERAPTRELFRSMRHPYTKALVGSLPRMSDPAQTRLTAIAGRPPDLVNPPTGCRFAPRCASAQPRCLVEAPPLAAISRNHVAACFYPVGTEAGDAARAQNFREGRTSAGLPLADDRGI